MARYLLAVVLLATVASATYELYEYGRDAECALASSVQVYFDKCTSSSSFYMYDSYVYCQSGLTTLTGGPTSTADPYFTTTNFYYTTTQNASTPAKRAAGTTFAFGGASTIPGWSTFSDYTLFGAYGSSNGANTKADGFQFCPQDRAVAVTVDEIVSDEILPGGFEKRMWIDCNGNGAEMGDWFKYTHTGATRDMMVTTCFPRTTGDTKVTVYQATNGVCNNCVAGNDDGPNTPTYGFWDNCEDNSYASNAQWEAVSGETYYIQVSPFSMSPSGNRLQYSMAVQEAGYYPGHAGCETVEYIVYYASDFECGANGLFTNEYYNITWGWDSFDQDVADNMYCSDNVDFKFTYEEGIELECTRDVWSWWGDNSEYDYYYREACGPNQTNPGAHYVPDQVDDTFLFMKWFYPTDYTVADADCGNLDEAVSMSFSNMELGANQCFRYTGDMAQLGFDYINPKNYNFNMSSWWDSTASWPATTTWWSGFDWPTTTSGHITTTSGHTTTTWNFPTTTTGHITTTSGHTTTTGRITTTTGHITTTSGHTTTTIPHESTTTGLVTTTSGHTTTTWNYDGTTTFTAWQYSDGWRRWDQDLYLRASCTDDSVEWYYGDFDCRHQIRTIRTDKLSDAFGCKTYESFWFTNSDYLKAVKVQFACVGAGEVTTTNPTSPPNTEDTHGGNGNGAASTVAGVAALAAAAVAVVMA